MMWKCSLTVIVGEGVDADVVTEERVATDPRLGLDLLWRRVQEQLSLMALPVRATESCFQVLGWCDPIMEPYRGADAHQQQKMLDRTRARDEELKMATLIVQERCSLDDAVNAQSKVQEGQKDVF